MYLLTFFGGAMFGGIVTLFLHCCLILGKESDKKWEEEQIGVRIDIWTHLMRGCIINYVY